MRQRKAIKIALENGGNVSKAMREAGYSKAMAKNPQKIKKSKTWQQLMDKFLPEQTVAEVHAQLLRSTRIEHAVFPVSMKDEEIIDLLATVNCTAKKFMHSEMQTHCWFWAPDNLARKAGVEMAHKLRGNFAPEKHEVDVTGFSLVALFKQTSSNKKDKKKKS